MPDDVFLELAKARVARLDRPWEEAIAVNDGRTLPFAVERSWSGPAGKYIEQWSIRRGMGEILYESDPKYVFVRGIQSITTHTDRVEVPFEIDPGRYRLVFAVEGYFMGAVDIEAVSAGTAAA